LLEAGARGYGRGMSDMGGVCRVWAGRVVYGRGTITQHIGKHYSIEYNARLSYQWYKTLTNSSHGLELDALPYLPSSMALTLISATSSSSTSSFGCIDNFPRPPTSIPTKSSSTVFNSTAHLVHTPPSYLPMPHTNTDHQYIPFNPSLSPSSTTKSAI